MAQNKKLIPVSLLTGYLGSGKTTLLNHILSNQEGYKVAVIVNDIGEVNIDASLIQRGGAVTEKDENLVPLSNGCICCTLKVDLMKQIVTLASSGRFDYILIEASGICEPGPIAGSICMLDGTDRNSQIPAVAYLDGITTVVDAKRMADEFGSGKSLLNKDLEEDDIENLLVEQIEYCTTIVLNKIDEVTPEEKADVLAVIKALQPEAEIIETTFGKVEAGKILSTNKFDYEEILESPGWMKAMAGHEHEDDDDDDDDDHEHHHEHEHEHGHHHHHHEHGETEEYGIATFVYENVKPLSKAKFEEFVFAHYPKEIIRAKGIFWIKEDPDTAYIFETSGRQKTATDDGKWIACYPKMQQEMILQMNPDIAASWHPVYGDRVNKIVFIGRNMDKKAIIAAMDNCVAE